MLVLGNSATAGEGLSDRSLAWPFVVGRTLETEFGVPVEVENVVVVPKGPKAAPYALAKVEAANPDLVVVSIGSYFCAIRTVEAQVLHLFGERARARYVRLERRFDRGTSSGSRPGRATNRAARSILHRIIGGRPIATVSEVAAVWDEILHRLARFEGTQVAVFFDPAWPERVARANRGAQAAQDRLRSHVKATALAHHFLWASAQDTYALAPDREALYMHDGVHKSVLGHEVQAEALLNVLRERLPRPEPAAVR